MIKEQTRAYAFFMLVLLVLGLVIFIPTSQPQQATARLDLKNDFSLAETTYTNKTMHFETGDPYDSYSHWSYTSGAGAQGPSDGLYYMDTDSGEYTYFGYDEFVDHSIIQSEVLFNPTGISGTYKFQPIGYFYQKTALETNTHWALVLEWTSAGLTLYYNTGNGNSPSTTNLIATPPSYDGLFRITLLNFGNSTFVGVYNYTAYQYSTVYSGYATTSSYDARSLYAGFGEYCTAGVNTWGRWDNFTIRDTSITGPASGVGLSKIDAYLDEAYAHTFFDIDSGYNSSLDVDVSTTNITLIVQCWLNGTLCNIGSVAEGANILRHNVTVTNTNHTTLFTQSNFTYMWGIEYEEGSFLYQYSVQLIFDLVMGEIYTAVLTMEVYYPEVE